jgi:hypothetical protein
MGGEMRLGYQLAQICLQTHLCGRQWLSVQHHPGSAVSASCLLGLIEAAERSMGCTLAKGSVANFDGTIYSPLSDDRTVIVSNGSLHNLLLNRFAGV